MASVREGALCLTVPPSNNPGLLVTVGRRVTVEEYARAFGTDTAQLGSRIWYVDRPMLWSNTNLSTGKFTWIYQPFAAEECLMPLDPGEPERLTHTEEATA